jgi:hypothetical protein
MGMFGHDHPVISTDSDRNIGLSYTIGPDNVSCNLLQTAAVLGCHHTNLFFLPADFGKRELERQQGSFPAMHEERNMGLDKSQFLRVWEVRQTCSLCPTGLGIMTGSFASAAPANDPFLGFPRLLVA